MVEQLKSKRLSGLGEYYFSKKLREIEQMNNEGHNVINLGIGSPDLPPPASVKEALMNAFNESNYHQYQSYKGIADLRHAFSRWYGNHFRVHLDAESQILPLIGSKEGVIHISMSLLDAGDQALVPNPGYPVYKAATTLAGGEPIEYALKESNQYQPDFEALERMDLKRVKIMWVNYPHMPTGADSTDELFDRLIAFSRKHGIVVINDNPYGFILTEQRRSLLEKARKSDLVIELNSLSKSHNMAGWRIGVATGNADLIQTALTFKSNMDSGQFKPIMRAAIAALDESEDWYESLNSSYRSRRKQARQIADLIGCKVNENEVGMFVWAGIPSHFADGETFTDHLLNKYRIFIPPGSVFGSEGKSYIRFSLCSPEVVWVEVINRIKTEK